MAKNFILSLKAAIATAVLVSSLTGWASEPDVRQRLEEANLQIAEFEASDYRDEATQDIATARMEVGDVQALLGQGNVSQAEIVLRRLEARVGKIESVLERATIEQLADERESESIRIQQDADQLQIDLVAAERRREALQEEVDAIIETLRSDDEENE